MTVILHTSLVTGRIVSSKNSYAEVLTLSTKERDLIWN